MSWDAVDDGELDARAETLVQLARRGGDGSDPGSVPGTPGASPGWAGRLSRDLRRMSLEAAASEPSQAAVEASAGGRRSDKAVVDDPLGLGRVDCVNGRLEGGEGGSRRGLVEQWAARAALVGGKQGELGLEKTSRVLSFGLRRTQSLGPGESWRVVCPEDEDVFDPLLYLVSVHHGTDLAGLEAGALKLEDQLKERGYALQEMVRENFGRFIGCKDVMDVIHERLRNDGDAGTDYVLGRGARVKKKLLEAEAGSRAFHAPIAERHAEAERLREALDALRRCSATQLPSKMHGHLKAGRKDLAEADLRSCLEQVEKNATGILGDVRAECLAIAEAHGLKV